MQDDARFAADVTRVVGPGRLRRDVPLAPFTSFQLGGPADWFVDAATIDEVEAVAAAARAALMPLTVLGGGTNVVVADAGVRGVVVRLRLMGLSRPGADTVRAEAGVTMNGLVRWTVARGLAGLEAWAGTPGTVGGAIHGNAHFGGRNIGDLVRRVRLLGRDGAAVEAVRGEMGFAYDTSRLQHSGEVLLWAEFEVTAGTPEALRNVARASLAFRKRTQPLPLPSAGCVFQNPSPERDALPPGMPASAGALVEAAGLKGHTIGGARISERHANFIVNAGGATAGDVRALVELAREAVREKFGVLLRDEVVYLGEFHG